MTRARKLWVLIGPAHSVREFVETQRLNFDDYIAVNNADALHGLDPVDMLRIYLVQAEALGARTHARIKDEIRTIKALWPIPVAVAP